MLALFLVPASQETRDPDFERLISEFLTPSPMSSWRPGHLFKVTCMSARCNACGPHGLNTSRGVGEKECQSGSAAVAFVLCITVSIL